MSTGVEATTDHAVENETSVVTTCVMTEVANGVTTEIETVIARENGTETTSLAGTTSDGTIASGRYLPGPPSPMGIAEA